MNQTRRGFMGYVFGGVAGVGAVASLYAMKRSWDPLPSVKAAGFTTVDLSSCVANKLVVEKWRGKPIFVLRKTPEMVAAQTIEIRNTISYVLVMVVSLIYLVSIKKHRLQVLLSFLLLK
jgi:Rieske Fe-S protein